jgi:hypothetical protein
MMAQQELFEAKKDTSTPKTLTAMVLKIMSDGKWRLPWEISNIILRDYSVRISDSSLTARLRELRSVKHGRHTVEKRSVDNSNAYEYRVVG